MWSLLDRGGWETQEIFYFSFVLHESQNPMMATYIFQQKNFPFHPFLRPYKALSSGPLFSSIFQYAQPSIKFTLFHGKFP